jgi:hypothetical protein
MDGGTVFAATWRQDVQEFFLRSFSSAVENHPAAELHGCVATTPSLPSRWQFGEGHLTSRPLCHTMGLLAPIQYGPDVLTQVVMSLEVVRSDVIGCFDNNLVEKEQGMALDLIFLFPGDKGIDNRARQLSTPEAG